MLSPCKECQDRAIGCHSRCSRYSVFKKKLEKINEAKSKDFITGYNPQIKPRIRKVGGKNEL